jgi:hypothetical protein
MSNKLEFPNARYVRVDEPNCADLFMSSKHDRIFLITCGDRGRRYDDDRCISVFDCNLRHLLKFGLPKKITIQRIIFVPETNEFVIIASDDSYDCFLLTMDVYGNILSKKPLSGFWHNGITTYSVSDDKIVFIQSGEDWALVINIRPDEDEKYEFCKIQLDRPVTNTICDRLIDNRYVLCVLDNSYLTWCVDLHSGKSKEIPIISCGRSAYYNERLCPDRIYLAADYYLFELTKKYSSDDLDFVISRAISHTAGTVGSILSLDLDEERVICLTRGYRDPRDFITNVYLPEGRYYDMYDAFDIPWVCPDLDGSNKYCFLALKCGLEDDSSGEFYLYTVN